MGLAESLAYKRQDAQTVSGMNLVPGLGRPVMVMQYQVAADALLAVPVFPEEEAVAVPVGEERDYGIAAVGPVEVVADGSLSRVSPPES